MFWNNPYFNSIKFHTLRFYTLSVISTLTLACAAFILIFYFHEANQIDHALSFFRDEFEYEYLTGDEEQVGAVRISDRALPTNQPWVTPTLYALRTAEGNYINIAERDGQRIKQSYDVATHQFTEATLTGQTLEFVNTILNSESHGDGTHETYIMIASPSHQVLTRSPFDESFVNSLLRFETDDVGNVRHYRKHHASEHYHSYIRSLTHRMGDGNYLIIAINTTAFQRRIVWMIIYAATFLVLVVIFCLFFGIAISDRFARTIQNLTKASKAAGQGDFSHPVPILPNTPTEILILAKTFNSMCQNTNKMMTELRMISDNIAHDLRTPLTRMKSEAELSLYNDAITRENLASDVSEECNKMLDMINTMLEITQTEYRIQNSPRQSLDLKEIIERMVSLYGSIAEDKGITLTTALPDTPVTFEGHTSKLQQLINNLLDNALKFTPSGGHVKLTLQKTLLDITLTIEDNGSGILPKDLPHIFDRFYRADTSRTLPGNGLGLSLVRAITTSYGGNVSVQSTPNESTTFTITLPIIYRPSL